MFVPERAFAAALVALLAGARATQDSCTYVQRGDTEAIGAELPDVVLEPYNSYFDIDINPNNGCRSGTVHVGTYLVACDLSEPEVKMDSLVHAIVHRTSHPNVPGVVHITVYCAPVAPRCFKAARAQPGV